MDTLMRMQSSYDIARTRSREKQIKVRRVLLPEAPTRASSAFTRVECANSPGPWLCSSEIDCVALIARTLISKAQDCRRVLFACGASARKAEQCSFESFVAWIDEGRRGGGITNW
jgi:hypothetical protein